jgi:hypothetical protein
VKDTQLESSSQRQNYTSLGVTIWMTMTKIEKLALNDNDMIFMLHTNARYVCM